MELNFLGLETRKYMFYHQINGTTFFLAYFLTLEYILEIFGAQLLNIFRKNASRGKKGMLPPPRFQYTQPGNPIFLTTPATIDVPYIFSLVNIYSSEKN